jgi:hypothetical protein
MSANRQILLGNPKLSKKFQRNPAYNPFIVSELKDEVGFNKVRESRIAKVREKYGDSLTDEQI